MLFCTYSFLLAQVVRIKDHKKANAEGQKRKIGTINIHSDSTAWLKTVWWLRFGIWQYPLICHSAFKNLSHSKKKKKNPCLVLYFNDVSVWFYSSWFALYHCRLAGFLNPLPNWGWPFRILFSPRDHGFPYSSPFREVKASISLPAPTPELSRWQQISSPSGSLTPTFLSGSGPRIQFSSEEMR